MKLTELSAPKPSKQIAKVFESYFGSRISFDQLTRGQTAQMLTRVRGVLGEHRATTARHTSERDPKYLQLVMMEQALSSRLREDNLPIAPAAPVAGAAAQPKPAAPGPAAKDPKVAMMAAESRLRRAMKRLNESEVQQAQVVLAAQDMVDKMQGMLEDVTELQFKELPALVDSIKNQVGMEQAQQFNTDATAALSGLVGNLQGAKQQLDAALNVVTGQAAPGGAVPGAADAAMAGADIGAADADMAAADDMGADAGLDAAAADAGADMGAKTPAAALGRARR